MSSENHWDLFLARICCCKGKGNRNWSLTISLRKRVLFHKMPAVKEWNNQACFSMKYQQVDVSYHRLNCKPTKNQKRKRENKSEIFEKHRSNIKMRENKFNTTKTISKSVFNLWSVDFIYLKSNKIFVFNIMWLQRVNKSEKTQKNFWHELWFFS